MTACAISMAMGFYDAMRVEWTERASRRAAICYLRRKTLLGADEAATVLAEALAERAEKSETSTHPIEDFPRD